MNLRETTSILFVLMRVLYATTSIKEAHYTQWKGYKLHSNTRIMAQDKSSSSFRCWRKCLDTHACVATSYSPTQSGCELHEIWNVLLPIKVIAEKDRTVIVKKGLNVNDLTKSWIQFGAPDCYIGSSHDYTGTYSKTVSNRDCQEWNENYPHAVSHKPIYRLDYSTNYCRATAIGEKLWCYTTDPSTDYQFENCPIIPCFACGVLDSPPTRPPNTILVVSFTHVVVATFQCLSFKQGLSQKHCPVSSCRSDDQWSTDYNVSCTNDDCFTISTGYKGKYNVRYLVLHAKIGTRIHLMFFFNRNPEVCYDHIGCFSNVAPYDNANGRIPESPDHIQTEILLYTRQNPTEEFLLNAYDVSNISHSHFDGSKKTVFIIHGYNDYATSDLIQDIKYELLIKDDMNVIAVNWQYGADNVIYAKSAANTRVVGAIIGELLKNLHSAGQTSYSKIHLVGHSLGAHICGYAGAIVGGRIAKITGLDPAGPCFELKDPVTRLDTSDAHYVEVIHTNGASLLQFGN
ncbi:Lipase member I,Lipase member H-A,Pancreatic triacylglycerol lipase,Lipase member H,Inactive pancreatic lipase-related protein 1,Lipase member H-B,Pancreatic lipase-related protein 2 [Mytilus edulis]|uniref:Lipase member I,Lipase member H-A,Pancreatic triacylglycerol lipase,Lipase member H,Inactive pancreatic lipase-related protein 1,Lipase member H-B,Pancreatic lipase-related protein 2 n=1 Tax=Mytilus edulis TaxID=6550 RepID=A0A8S3QW64_MYTED|nr:Lipase member I,Lipase member H-A,Pancreatic triacylglycerol lipase,Lipase member H,Inactive pancreatic lipase-related protein 1,Lipase member H-B,Pancreatic lipase-related protein 2 [Mytilus edulis]